MKKLLLALITFFAISAIFCKSASATACSFPYNATSPVTLSSTCGIANGTVDGVDNVNGPTTNNAQLIVPSNTTLTVNSDSVLAFGSITITQAAPHATIVIDQTASHVGALQKGPLYIGGIDHDGDGHLGGILAGGTLQQVAQKNGVAAPSGGVRKGAQINNDITTIGASSIVDSGGYRTVKFYSGGTIVNPYGVTMDVLVVGAGGGGGIDFGGGGGGGGVIYKTSYSLSAGSHSVTVGTGGAGGTVTPLVAAGKGGDSVFDAITATGGGGGVNGSGHYVGTVVKNGGNGGGGAGFAAAPVTTPGNGNTPSVSPSQGNNGGSGYYTGVSTSDTGGGGGGAGPVSGGTGGSGLQSVGGNGGIGALNSITGVATYYAGGGGGGAYSTSVAGIGQSGGGNGATGVSTSGTAGTANTGGGGGGGSGGGGGTGGRGGDGIVIVRYAYYAAPASQDCNDNNNLVWQNLAGYHDGDGDGYADSTSTTQVCSGASLVWSAQYPYTASPQTLYNATTGGSVSDAGGYRTVTYTTIGTSGSITVNTALSAQALVVAGGGGGGSSVSGNGGGGGGGAGGVVYNGAYTIPVGTTYPWVGGGGGGGGAGAGATGSQGGASAFGSITAYGGGGGGKGINSGGGVGQGGAGFGAGGGAGYNGYAAGTPGPLNSGQGYGGGQNGYSSGAGGGGGGGCGAAGSAPNNSPIHDGGNGGVGCSNPITGAYYGGGGGGGGGSESGGTGGGGAGGGMNIAGVSGTANTGGGGGATYAGAAAAGNGGSGIVVIRYQYPIVAIDCNDNNAGPCAPTNLTVIQNGLTELDLSWTAPNTDNGPTATGYNIYRCAGPSCTPSTLISSQAGTTYADTGLPTYTYGYYVIATNNSGANLSAPSTTQYQNTGCTNQTVMTDADQDGYTVGSSSVQCTVGYLTGPGGRRYYSVDGSTYPWLLTSASLGTDCNDATASVFAAVTCYVDGDNDGYGAGSAYTCMNNATCASATLGAIGAGAPSSHIFRANNTDCCDSDNRAYPGETSCYSGAMACGGYDYDCSGSTTKYVNNSGSCLNAAKIAGSTSSGLACGDASCSIGCGTCNYSANGNWSAVSAGSCGSTYYWVPSSPAQYYGGSGCPAVYCASGTSAIFCK